MSGLLLSDDLIFTSRITATARAFGGVVLPCRTIEQLQTKLREALTQCVIVDLNHPAWDTLGGVALVRSVVGDGPMIVAYGSHVDAERLRTARQSGCNLVLPRSAFVERLEGELTAWLVGTAQA